MTFNTLARLLLDRLGDDPDALQSRQHYTMSEAYSALGRVENLFALFTLCLETTGTFTLTGGGAPYYHLFNSFADYLVPLRFRVQAGRKLNPQTFPQLAALDSQWNQKIGEPTKYAHLGFDFFACYKRPSSNTVIEATYARCPVAPVSTAEPEIPVQYHPCLLDGALPLMRVKEGAQEWQKNLDLWERFMDSVQELGGRVRARSIEQGYDTLPIEIARLDRSRLLRKAG